MHPETALWLGSVFAQLTGLHSDRLLFPRAFPMTRPKIGRRLRPRTRASSPHPLLQTLPCATVPTERDRAHGRRRCMIAWRFWHPCSLLLCLLRPRLRLSCAAARAPLLVLVSFSTCLGIPLRASRTAAPRLRGCLRVTASRVRQYAKTERLSQLQPVPE